MCINDKVTKIIDGDTIQVGTYKIRLALTNTPEKNQPGFKEATEFTKSLCPINSLAIVDQDDKQPYDKYKRMVGKVFCGNKVLNSELLYSNHANILTTYCKTSEFSSEPWAKKFGC
jgi:micrococcal nuclease